MNKEIKRHNLPLDHKYTLINTEFNGMVEDGNAEACQNCGKLIVNVATIQNEQGNNYRIGLDCAETLSYVDASTKWKLEEKRRSYNRMLKWRREVKKWIKNDSCSIIQHDTSIFICDRPGRTRGYGEYKIRLGLDIYRAMFQNTLDHMMIQYQGNLNK